MGKETAAVGTTSGSSVHGGEVNFRLNEKVGTEGVSVKMAQRWRAPHRVSGRKGLTSETQVKVYRRLTPRQRQGTTEFMFLG